MTSKQVVGSNYALIQQKSEFSRNSECIINGILTMEHENKDSRFPRKFPKPYPQLGQDYSPSWRTIFIARDLLPWFCLQNVNALPSTVRCQAKTSPPTPRRPMGGKLSCPFKNCCTQCWLEGSSNLEPQSDKDSSVRH